MISYSTFRGATRGSKIVVAGALAPPVPPEPPLRRSTESNGDRERGSGEAEGSEKKTEQANISGTPFQSNEA